MRAQDRSDDALTDATTTFLEEVVDDDHDAVEKAATEVREAAEFNLAQRERAALYAAYRPLIAQVQKDTGPLAFGDDDLERMEQHGRDLAAAAERELKENDVDGVQ
jgi:hypothetical protein